ncbi:MAG: IS21 family transposase [Actinomycetota bacterium]|nr:IS21 family transposase [Actinomycetota bacterium]
MLTREDDIDAHALHKRGWKITTIANHLGRDRKTIRAYLTGERVAGQRARSSPDLFERYEPYCAARLGEDPHLWASTLMDELTDLGFTGSYPTLTRQLRVRGLRPACEPCRPTSGRPVAVIGHPAGEETQWDWVELPDPPAAWGWGKQAHLLVGALAHSGRWRGVLVESEDQPHLIEAMDRVTRALGGVSRVWRFDRMATVCHPASGKVTASFSAVAKHYGVSVAICPARRGNRKGVVEKANHVAAQRFWRTLPDELTVAQAQARLDDWCVRRGDTRIRATADGKFSVATVAAREPLLPVPAAPFPAELVVARTVSAQALVAYAGNFYSVAPELARTGVFVRVRLGAGHLQITTTTEHTVAIVLARHRLAPTGAGVMVRDHGHVLALDTAAMAAASSAPAHRSKVRIPPGAAALAAAQALPGNRISTGTDQAAADSGALVIDLARYAAAAAGRNTLTS